MEKLENNKSFDQLSEASYRLVDTLLQESEIQSILSDKEFISEIDALGKFRSKLAQTNLSDTIEIQFQFLLNFYSIDENNLTKTSLTDLQDAFVENEYSTFINAHTSIFANKVSYEDKFLKAMAMGFIGRRLNMSEEKDYIEKVLNKYLDILDKYKIFARNYIISNNKFEYTCNSEEVYRRYVELEQRHKKFRDSCTTNGIAVSQIPNMVSEFVPVVKQIRNDGLDDYTYTNMFSDFFVLQFKFVCIFVSNPIFSVGGSVTASIVTTIEQNLKAANLVRAELEILPKSQVELDNIIDSLNNELNNKKGGNNSGGCYIATMVYGSYNHPQVMILRQFRDNVLDKSSFGKWFIKMYYRYSPELVEKLKDKRLINKIIKEILNLFIQIVKNEYGDR
jgi:hypothetical protein